MEREGSGLREVKTCGLDSSVLGLYIELQGRGNGKVPDPPDLTQASSAKTSGEDAVFTHTQLLHGAVERKRSCSEELRQQEPAEGLRPSTGRASCRPGAQLLLLAEIKGLSVLIWAPAGPRETGLSPRVEHLEQQLACSPAVYHRKGRKTRNSRRP